MKQKIIIQVAMHSEKCRSKAMKIAVSMEGVTSVCVDQENNRLVIIGDGVDSISLTTSLRKKLSYAIIVMVEEIQTIQKVQMENANQNGKDESEGGQPAVQWQPCYEYPFPQRPFYYSYMCRPVYDPPPPPNCSIM